MIRFSVHVTHWRWDHHLIQTDIRVVNLLVKFFRSQNLRCCGLVKIIIVLPEVRSHVEESRQLTQTETQQKQVETVAVFVVVKCYLP